VLSTFLILAKHGMNVFLGTVVMPWLALNLCLRFVMVYLNPPLPKGMTVSECRQSSLNPTSPLIQFTQPLNASNFRLKQSLNTSNHLINKECLLELQWLCQIMWATDQLIFTTTELTAYPYFWILVYSLTITDFKSPSFRG